MEEKPNTKIQKGDTILEGKNICKGFPGVWEHLILDHIDIDIRAGEIHTMLGENGAGKTVIRKLPFWILYYYRRSDFRKR